MKPGKASYDAVVIGGGFYGATIALFLRQHVGSVLLLERESDLLTRASLVNQARVHNGYHYPRSFMTALRSFVNFPRFSKDYSECIESGFEQYYAVARDQSKTSAAQFLRVFGNLGLPIKPAKPSITRLFSKQLIEGVFLTTEYAFNAVALRSILRRQLEESGIEVALEAGVRHLAAGPNESLVVEMEDGDRITAQRVYNCTYAAINPLLKASGLPLLPLKNELAEIALVQPPPELEGLGVTVMDGPFFSTMPYPAQSLYSFSHVRYTPHTNWQDDSEAPGKPNSDRAIRSNFPFMIRDAARYMPCLAKTTYVDSLFDVKTVMVKSEGDDGRPILLRQDYHWKNLYVVMGGKIDNIYDVVQALQGVHATRRAVDDPFNRSKSFGGCNGSPRGLHEIERGTKIESSTHSN